MKNYSFKYDGYEQLKKDIESQISDLNDEVLVQIFTSISEKVFIQKVVNDVKRLIPTAKIIGSTVSGEIYKGKSLRGSCVLSVSTFHSTRINTYISKGTTKEEIDLEITSELGQIIDKDTKAAISFVSCLPIEREDLIRGLIDVLADIPIVGGTSGSLNIVLDSTSYVFNEEQVVEKGVIVGTLSGDSLKVHTDNNFNWIPISKEYTVTEVLNGSIISIENEPAKDFYQSYTGVNLDENERMGKKFPFFIKKDGIEISLPLFSGEHNSIYVGTGIKAGEKIRLGFGNKADLLNASTDMYNRLNDKMIEAIFVYSCEARRNFLDEMIDYDIEAINTIFPVSGGYLFGEFNHIQNKNVLSSLTMTLIGLSEDEHTVINTESMGYEAGKFLKSDEEIVLQHIVKTTGKELHELTINLEEKVKEKTEELVRTYLINRTTGLYNRRKLTEDIESKDFDYLVNFQIKNLQDINRFYGMEIGDQLLKEVSKVLKERSLNYGLRVYVFEGGIFTIMVSKEYAIERVIQLFGEIQSELMKKVFVIKRHTINVDIILGIVKKSNNLLGKVNLILDYCHRENLSCELYSDRLGLDEEIERNHRTINEIRKAINEDKIVPYFQPIIDNQTSKIVKYEALMRMIDSDGRVISPGFFLDIAIKSGLYDQLTRIMLRKTFDVFYSHELDFSINLQLSDIKNMQTRKVIMELLQNKDSGNRVIFEIVESEEIEQFDEVKQFINEVKQYGARIAIDDFGSGYSNFVYLAQLDIDYIKIDGSIIKRIHEDENSRLIAQTIVAFSKRLGAKTIGEYVHNEAVYVMSKQLSVDYSQGFYFAEPMKEIT